MATPTGLTKGRSIWEPKFIKEINSKTCLDCDRFYEVAGRNALRLQSINKDNNNNEHQIMTIGNPEQCADCQICTSS